MRFLSLSIIGVVGGVANGSTCEGASNQRGVYGTNQEIVRASRATDGSEACIAIYNRINDAGIAAFRQDRWEQDSTCDARELPALFSPTAREAGLEALLAIVANVDTDYPLRVEFEAQGAVTAVRQAAARLDAAAESGGRLAEAANEALGMDASTRGLDKLVAAVGVSDILRSYPVVSERQADRNTVLAFAVSLASRSGVDCVPAVSGAQIQVHRHINPSVDIYELIPLVSCIAFFWKCVR